MLIIQWGRQGMSGLFDLYRGCVRTVLYHLFPFYVISYRAVPGLVHPPPIAKLLRIGPCYSLSGRAFSLQLSFHPT